jgi:trimethylamine--corrinoid protein Co-methyltransferase
MTSMLAALSGANLIYGMGMLELGKSFNYAQLVIDNEIAAMIKRVVRGVDVSDELMAVDLINRIGGGEGKDYLAEDHTIEYMHTEQQHTLLFDRRSYDNWKALGGLDLATRATQVARDIFHTHKPEPIDADIQKQMKKIIEGVEKSA